MNSSVGDTMRRSWRRWRDIPRVSASFRFSCWIPSTTATDVDTPDWVTDDVVTVHRATCRDCTAHRDDGLPPLVHDIACPNRLAALAYWVAHRDAYDTSATTRLRGGR